MKKSIVLNFVLPMMVGTSGILADSGLEGLEASRIATGYEQFFEQVSEKNFKPISKEILRKDLNEKVGVFTTKDLRDSARYAQATYHFDAPSNSADLNRFTKEGTKYSFLKSLTKSKDLTWGETVFENQDTGIFFEKADGTAELAFKGSDRANTWASDFNPVMRNHENGGRYHGGFLTMYEELAPQIWQSISKFAANNNYTVEEAIRKIRVSGHSRGAGAAQVFSDIARRITGVAPETILFAAPRALHKHTAADYNAQAKDKTLNFAQAKDPVHYVAFSALNGGAHVGNKVFTALDNAIYPHMMDGYRNMANMMHNFEKVSQDPLNENLPTYSFKAVEENRDLASEKDHSVQAYVESVIDGFVSTAKNVASKTLDFVQNTASTVASFAKKALNFVKFW